MGSTLGKPSKKYITNIIHNKRGGITGAAKLFIETNYEENIYEQNMPSLYRPSSEGYLNLTRARVEFKIPSFRILSSIVKR